MKSFLNVFNKVWLFGSRYLVALCCALLLLETSLATASAHKPLFKASDISTPARAMSIPDPTTSWAIYGSLDHPAEADYYAFRVQPSGLILDAMVTIPALNTLKNFTPHLALLGPGLPGLAPQQVSFVIPLHDGAQLIDAPHTGTADHFYEPFTQTTYWNRQRFKEPLREPGLYYLVVFNRSHDAPQTGKYVLAVGNVERVGPGDILTFPLTYVRVRFFAGAGLPFWGWLLLALPGLLLAWLVVLCWRGQRRQRLRRAAR